MQKSLAKNIIVTGATGFIGKHLVRKIKSKNNNIHVIARKQSGLAVLPNDVTVHPYDGTTKSLVNIFERISPDVVYHLASCVVTKHEIDQLDSVIDANIKFGTQLMEASVKSNCKKFINTGTAWQNYNNKPNSPVCLYAATKQAFENIIEHYVQNEKMNVITLKLHDNYGLEDDRGKLLSLLIDSAVTGKFIELSPGDQKIDLLNVFDIAKAFEIANKILDNATAPCHMQYMVYSGRQISIKELAELISSLTGMKINALWGGRNYRDREMMLPPYHDQILPGWSPSINLEDGIMQIWNSKKAIYNL